MKVFPIAAAVILFIIGSLAMIYFVSSGTQISHDKMDRIDDNNTEIIEIYLGKSKVFAEVVKTPEEIRRGLSGRENLLSDHGMLFVFSSPGRHGFWMKEMKFPIDIIWLDENKKIIHIERRVQPETYPAVFYPDAPALFVLEVEAGFADSEQIGIGTDARF